MYEATKTDRLDMIGALVKALNNAINQFDSDNTSVLTNGDGSWSICYTDDEDQRVVLSIQT